MDADVLYSNLAHSKSTITLDGLSLEKEERWPPQSYRSFSSRLKILSREPRTYFIAATIIYTLLSLGVIWALSYLHEPHAAPPYISHSYHESPRPGAPPPGSNTTDPFCGTTTTEAVGLGCRFDLYTLGWVPRDCYNPSVSADSESSDSVLAPLGAGADSFSFYWDEERTRLATRADLEAAGLVNGERGENIFFWSRLDYHRAHCLHVWRLQASMLERMREGQRGLGLTMEGVELAHVIHCSKLMLDRVMPGDHLLKVNPGVRRCVVMN